MGNILVQQSRQCGTVRATYIMMDNSKNSFDLEPWYIPRFFLFHE
jgi:hypothetical protein